MSKIWSESEEVAPMRHRATYHVEDERGPGDVNFRMGQCWRPDGRFPGEWMMRRHESGGAEITFTGSQHNSRDIVKVIAAQHVDKFILSLLEVRAGREQPHP